VTDADKSSDAARDYVLEDQVGYVLRRVTQRHLAIFSEVVPAVTTTQFAVMARLAEGGAQSQNQLGRAAAMDGATIKGVVDRLVRQGFVATAPDEADRRRLTVALTNEGLRFFNAQIAAALAVSDKTLNPLSKSEQAQFLALLARLT
jgi:DNA-binding MarR family transcriptional regulator